MGWKKHAEVSLRAAKYADLMSCLEVFALRPEVLVGMKDVLPTLSDLKEVFQDAGHRESHFQPVLPACSWVAAFQFCRAHIRYPEAPRFLLPPELPCWNSRTSNPGRLRLTINLNSPWKINSQGCSSRKDPAAKVIDREYAPAAERKSVPSTPFHFPLLSCPSTVPSPIPPFSSAVYSDCYRAEAQQEQVLRSSDPSFVTSHCHPAGPPTHTVTTFCCSGISQTMRA